MQAIFDFQGKLADWDSQVCKHFPLAGELSTPWRWKNVGEEGFGQRLLDVRKELLAGKPVDLTKAHANVSWVNTGGKMRMRAGLQLVGQRRQMKMAPF
jgi:hypothetical protein